MTRGCAATGINGVPVGKQVETPDWIAIGCPCDNTRTVPTIHCAVTQGPFPGGGTNAQPATAYGAAMVAIGMPETKTNGLGTVGTACPPCAHITVAPTCKIGPGTITPFNSARWSNHGQCSQIHVHRWTDQRDHGALTVADIDPCFIYDNHCPAHALENDPACER